MNGSSKHTLYGLIFIAACLLVAGILYAVVRSPAPTEVIENTSVADMRIDRPEFNTTPEATGAESSVDTPTPQNTEGEPKAVADVSESNEQSPPNSSPSATALFPEHRFADYPAPSYAGPPRLPTFSDAQRKFAEYRTALTRAARGRPSFAGSVAIASVGCGSGGCVRYFLVDTRSGQIFEHSPANAGDDDVLYDTLVTEPGSTLAFESFRRSDDTGAAQCVYNAYRWDEVRLTVLASKSRSASIFDECALAESGQSTS